MPARSTLPAAIGFLTRVPVRSPTAPGEGAVLFPLVGAGVGAAVGGTAFGLARVLPPLAAATVALAVGILLTGALHLDGLADTADALAGRSRDAALAIMRDHAVGTYGAAAVVLDLLVKAAALAALASRSRVVLEALAAGALSRATPVVLAFVLPRLRADGAGAAFGVGPVTVAVAVLLAAGLAVPAGPLLIGIAAAATIACYLWLRLRFGGRTGDTLGAATELVETAVLVGAAALA